MNTKLIYLYLFSQIFLTNSIVYLRVKNDRGPLAWKAGEECLGSVTRTFFYDKFSNHIKNAVILHTHNLTSPVAEIERLYLKRINNLFREFDGQRFQIRIISDNYKIDGAQNVPSNSLTPFDFYIIIVDDVEKLHHNMEYFITRAFSWNPVGKFVILFNNPSKRKNNIKIVLDIFNMLSVYYHATNVIILFGTGVTTYDVYSSDPFFGEKCRTMLPIKIGVCDNGEYDSPKQFEKYLQRSRIKNNLSLCTFQFCALVTQPFVESGCKSGLEIKIIELLESIMGFKITTGCSKLERGRIFDNGTVTGLLHKLRTDECHFIAGGFFPDDEVHRHFGVTVTYFQDSYTWFVPPASLKPRWVGLLYIFEINTWLVFGIILLLSGFVWYFLGKYPPEDFHHRHFILCCLNSFSVFLGVSSNNHPTQAPLRIFFITLALYGLNVTTLYTSNLIAVFTHQTRMHQIDTVQELLESKIPFGGRGEYLDWFLNDEIEDQEMYAKYNYSHYFQPTIENLKRVENGKQAILSNRLYMMATGFGERIFGFVENVFSNQLEMITIRGFPLLPKMNKLISFMKDSGFIAKIFEDFLYEIKIIGNIRETLNEIDNIESLEIVLTTEHLQGPFALFICGSIFSCFIFLIEILSVTPLKNWIILGVEFLNKKRSLFLIRIGLKENLKLSKISKSIKKKNVRFDPSISMIKKLNKTLK